MNTDPRLESYLGSLERALKPFSVSDRADIITEIKSHVLSSLEKDPQARLESMLEALGEPEVVANRYLMERGLKPTKPPISPAVKWIVIGFLGSFAMIFIFVSLVAFKAMNFVFNGSFKNGFSQLENEFDIDSATGSININGRHFNWGSKNHVFNGKSPSRPELEVKFSNSKMTFTTSNDGEIGWECKSAKFGSSQEQPTITDKKVSLDFTKMMGTKCEIRVPKTTKLNLQGNNGKIEFDEPQFSIDASLTNGLVNISPLSGGKYAMNLKVINGTAPSFTNSNDPNAVSIKVELTNGSIQIQD